jgi:hypothetical protein
LERAARRDPLVPPDPRYLGSVAALKAAWLTDTRAAVLIRFRLRGRLRALGPQTVLAVFNGARLLRAVPYAGAIDLRVSPRRTFIGVIEAGGSVTVVSRSGRQELAPTALPSPDARAIAWSPDERWTAIASPWSVYFLPTADIHAGRQPHVVRLPLEASDLAWR